MCFISPGSGPVSKVNSSMAYLHVRFRGNRTVDKQKIMSEMFEFYILDFNFPNRSRCHTKRGIGGAMPAKSLFWYDNYKDLKRCIFAAHISHMFFLKFWILIMILQLKYY